MANYFIFTKRRKSFVAFEMVIASLTISIWLCKKFKWDWVTGVSVGIGTLILLGWLFFGVRIFRYIISILFSLIWAFLGFMVEKSLTRSSIAHWLLMVLVFIISMLAHKDYFDFERKATQIEYEER